MIVIYLSIGLLIFIVGIIAGILSAPRADNSEIMRDIKKDSKLLGEFEGTLRGILHWDLSPALKKLIEKKLEELEGR